MQTVTRLGTFDDVLANANVDVQQLCNALRALIIELCPQCVEVPRPGEPSAAYGFGEKKMTEAFAYIMPQSNYANLGFYHGAAIADRHSILEGSGAKLRHIKIKDLAIVESVAVRSALKDAIEERRLALGV